MMWLIRKAVIFPVLGTRMKVVGKMASRVGKVFISGPTDRNMMEAGAKENARARENFGLLMEAHMKAYGKITRM